MSRSRGLAVLVVDDDPVVRERLTYHLRGWGHEAAVAADVPSALHHVDRDRPDLVICDVVLPGASGFDLLGELADLEPSLPVILISAHVGPDHAARAMRAGAHELLVKPLDVDELRAVVEVTRHRLRPSSGAAP